MCVKEEKIKWEKEEEEEECLVQLTRQSSVQSQHTRKSGFRSRGTLSEGMRTMEYLNSCGRTSSKEFTHEMGTSSSPLLKSCSKERKRERDYTLRMMEVASREKKGEDYLIELFWHS